MDKLRTFIAIEIPESIKEKIATVIEKLKERVGGLSWVRPSTLHVTVKFLGSVERERIEPIARALERIGSETSPFRVTIKGVGGFPSVKVPRVVWMGIEDCQELTELHRRVEQEMHRLGFEKETRPFRPHLTLCRVKGEVDRKRLSEELVRSVPSICETFVADGIILFKSELNPGGAIHTPLRHIHFRH